MQVVSAADPQWILPFTGLSPAQIRRLVRLVAERGAATVVDGRAGRPWPLPLADRATPAYALHQLDRPPGQASCPSVKLSDSKRGHCCVGEARHLGERSAMIE